MGETGVVTDYRDLEAIARDVAERCGRLIADERPNRLGVANTKSSETDIVTVMDTRSEALARELLRTARPDDGLFGEEGLDETGSTGITWVVDPIDGTVNYLYDIPAYSVSVAAVEGDPRRPGEWRPVAGAVGCPRLDEVFHASLGGGAWLSSGGRTRELRPEPPMELAASLLGTGFSYLAATRVWQGALLADLLSDVRDVRRMGSAALDMCYAAAGRLDVYYEHNLHAWDVAAAWLVASEAGLLVRGLTTPYPWEEMALVGRQAVVDVLASRIGEWLGSEGVRLG